MHIECIEYKEKYPRNTVQQLENVKGNGIAYVIETGHEKLCHVFNKFNDWEMIGKNAVVESAREGYDILFMVGRHAPSVVYRRKSSVNHTLAPVVKHNSASVVDSSVKSRGVGCIKSPGLIKSTMPISKDAEITPEKSPVKPVPAEVIPQGELSMAKVRLMNRMLDMIDEL